MFLKLYKARKDKERKVEKRNKGRDKQNEE